MDFSWLPNIIQSVLDQSGVLLQQLRGLLYSDSLGSVPVLGGMSGLELCVFAALTAAAMLNLAHLLLEWVKSQRLDPARILDLFKIMVFAAAMMFFAPWSRVEVASFGNLATGSIVGVSYQSVAQTIQSGEVQAKKALDAVSIVKTYQDLLNTWNTSRRQTVIDILANGDGKGRVGDPMLKALIDLRKQYVAEKRVGPDGFTDTLRDGWIRLSALFSTGIDVIQQGIEQGTMDGALNLLAVFGKAIANALVYFFSILVMWITYAFFALGVVKALIIFAFYLKIAAFFGLILVAPAVGLAYFPSMRGFAIQILRHVAVILILATAYAACYKAVFSDANLQSAIQLSMKTQLDDNKVNPVTDHELAAVKFDLIQGVISRRPIEQENSALGYFATMDPTLCYRAVAQMGRIVLALSTMTFILGQLYQVISGSMEGVYDPSDQFRRQAEEAAEMGT